MTPHLALWSAYTSEVLRWRLGDAAPPPQTVERPDAARTAARILRMHAAAKRAHCLLLGTAAPDVIRLVAEGLPPHAPPVVLEACPHTARAALPQLPPVPLLVDTSPWALLMLACAANLTPQACTIAWTQPKGATAGQTNLETWRKLFSASSRLPLSPAPASTPCISVGCILHPDEPKLNEFFAHIPAWVHEVVVVWDGTAPENTPACAAPVRAVIHPLNNDFAAQRNIMLAQCTGQWCLYLDADERLTPDTWDALPRLAACPGVGGVCLPRLTFEGDTAHARMGYGLWPDVQLRFFPLRPMPHFVGTVHERLLGLHGDLLLVPGMSLLHYSHIHKDSAALAARLEVFNRAAGAPVHSLNQTYPALPVANLHLTGAYFGQDMALRLPLPQESGADTIGGVQQEFSRP